GGAGEVLGAEEGVGLVHVGGEGGVGAQEADGDGQDQRLGDGPAAGDAGEEGAEDEASGEVDQKRAGGEARAEEPRRRGSDAEATQGAKGAAEGDGEDVGEEVSGVGGVGHGRNWARVWVVLYRFR